MTVFALRGTGPAGELGPLMLSWRVTVLQRSHISMPYIIPVWGD